MTIVCKHGALPQQCPLCDPSIEIVELQARIVDLEKQGQALAEIAMQEKLLHEQAETRVAELEETIQYAIQDADALCERTTVHECINWGRALLRRLGAALKEKT